MVVRTNVNCEECGAEFELVFDSENLIEPEYCPFCGKHDSTISYGRRNLRA